MKYFFAIAFSVLVVCNTSSQHNNTALKNEVLHTMKQATKFMVDKVSYQGGYVWTYLPDFSRRWGEMEAYKTMIWIQPPGTPSVGNLFLDAYHATGDEYYYQVALLTAGALIKSQHPSGGWHYMHDFAGEKSMKQWYETIGANGWRLEEFQHYYNNATFDDGGTIEAATLLLRLYVDKQDNSIKTALDKAIQFVLKSQYPNGGWPQRYPKTKKHPTKGVPDYTCNITFNDDVAEKNITFLLLCYNQFNDPAILEAIQKGMDNYIKMQLPMPQPGWAMQYTPEGKPSSARTYEPACISTGTTENNLYQLMYFYGLTGEKKFMARIPEAIDWLDNLHLPDSLIEENRTHPSFVEIGTNKPLYIHRRGSNATNGQYYADYHCKNTVCHYRSTRSIDIKSLRKSYNKLVSSNPQLFTANSILKTKQPFPHYFTCRYSKISDLNSRHIPTMEATAENVEKIISDLTNEGYWLTKLTAITNPYIGKAPKEITEGDYSTTRVGDKYDTSPYIDTNCKMKGISTGVFIKNMSLLIEYLTNN
ncbi:MAG: pectate lyase [Paludibacteraceae bacterium]|nr:pectate lyase [Paludibacteraceae bacterium]MBN2788392.1 pectate lyase [Paludibacteraceae bacterium]